MCSAIAPGGDICQFSGGNDIYIYKGVYPSTGNSSDVSSFGVDYPIMPAQNAIADRN
jgi:hypothetical protein